VRPLSSASKLLFVGGLSSQNLRLPDTNEQKFEGNLMVKKMKSAADVKADNSQLAAAVKESAQQIWLAGLGAFAKAQEEGTKVFETLVKEGGSIQMRTRAVAEEKLGEVTGKVTKVAGEVSKQATQSWDKLEQVFEQRVERALNRLGVPTSKEIQALIARVEELNASVQALGGKPMKATRAAATAKVAKSTKVASKAASKPAAKPTAKAAVVKEAKKVAKKASKSVAKVVKAVRAAATA
jgi:poly(hydroxyalkanoate) granule-associated protein